MTDEPIKTEPEVKSATDLKMEQMEKSIAEMKANYEAQVKELTEANKDLWSALHPVQPTPAGTPQPKTDNLRPQAEVLDEMVRKKLGLTD